MGNWLLPTTTSSKVPTSCTFAMVLATCGKPRSWLIPQRTISRCCASTQLSRAALPCRWKRWQILRLGRSVVVLGYPRMDVYGESHPTLTTGVVAKAEGLRDDPASFQTTASIRPGNSGSPVFDLEGHLLGVISARLLKNAGDSTASDPSAPISIGVKAGRILRLLNGVPRAARPAPFIRETAEEMYRRMMPVTVLVAAYP